MALLDGASPRLFIGVGASAPAAWVLGPCWALLTPDSPLFQLHDILDVGKGFCPRQVSVEPLQQTVAQGLEVAAAGGPWGGRERGGSSGWMLHSLHIHPFPFSLSLTQPCTHTPNHPNRAAQSVHPLFILLLTLLSLCYSRSRSHQPFILHSPAHSPSTLSFMHPCSQ